MVDMTDSTQYLSQEKFDELKAELKKLIEVDMVETAKRIDAAREMGDLSENAEYHAAREQLGWQKGREMEIKSILDNAQIIHAGSGDSIQLGRTFTVKVKDKEKVYTLVGAQEADPLEGRISNESPIGEALLGKKKGDVAVVELPAGEVEYKVISVE